MSSFLFLAALIFVVGCVNPSFWQPTSILNCFNDSVVFTLLAVGSAFVILTGEIDVSVGATLGMSAAVGATLLRDGSNWAVAILAALAIGAVIGFVNGFGVSVLQIPSLIFTLGVNGVVRGLIYVFTKGAWVENLPAGFTRMSNTLIAGQLTTFYAAAILAVIAGHLILTQTKKGKYFIAVGDNAAGATLVGIKRSLCGSGRHDLHVAYRLHHAHRRQQLRDESHCGMCSWRYKPDRRPGQPDRRVHRRNHYVLYQQDSCIPGIFF